MKIFCACAILLVLLSSVVLQHHNNEYLDTSLELSPIFKEKDQTDDILNSLREGDKIINLWPRGNYVVLLGITGSGKSTLAQFITSVDLNVIDRDDEIIFSDNETKIGTENSTESKTFISELIKDESTGVLFADSPGFGDTRSDTSPKFDISTNYFVYKTLKRSLRVKFVLTIAHTSVRPNYERHGFVDLLRYIGKLISNIQSYNFFLVVTKAEIKTKVKEDGEERIKNATAKFISDTKNTILNKIKTENDENEKQLKHRMVEVAEHLLKHVNGEFTNIGVFLRPVNVGRISEMSDLVANRVKLRSSILNNTLFTTSSSDDFKIYLSTTSKLQLKDTITPNTKNYLNNNFQYIFQHFFNVTKKYWKTKSEEIELCELEMKLVEKKNKFEKIQANVMQIGTASKALLSLMKEDTSVEIVQTIFSAVSTLNILNFFENIVKDNEDNSLKNLENIRKIRETVEFIDHKLNVLRALKLIIQEVFYNDYFTMFNINTTVIHTKMLNNQEFNNRFSINSENSAVLFKNITDKFQIKFHVLTDEDFIKLSNKCISNIFNYSYQCNSGTYTISSESILLSAVSYDSMKCPNMKIIRIFAFHTIFIDADIKLGGQGISLVIIAPAWKVIGNVKFLLDGRDGDGPEDPKGLDCDGEPGRPGYPGEKFWGVGQTFTDTQNLEVFLHGGLGGRGQNGCPGENANKGTSPTFYKGSFKTSRYSPRYFEKKEGSKGKYYYYGREATQARNGGNGGIGGKTGISGTANIINFSCSDNNIKINTMNKKTADLRGMGGSGGRQASESGEFAILVSSDIYDMSGHVHVKEDLTFKKFPTKRPSRDGEHGKNRHNIISPKASDTIINENKVLSNYKIELTNYLLNMKISHHNITLLFAQNLHKSSSILKFHREDRDIEYVSDETINMIEHSKSEHVNLEKLENAVKLLIENVELISVNITDKLAVQIILATLQSIKNTCVDRTVKTLVVNLKPYTDHALFLIEELKLKMASQEVNNRYVSYSADIDMMISEVTNTLLPSVSEELTSLLIQFERNSDILLQEIVRLENEALIHKRDLHAKKSQLNENIILESAFGVFKAILPHFGTLGNAGAAAYSTVQLFTGTDGSEREIDFDDSKLKFQIPEGVDNLIKKIAQTEKAHSTDFDILTDEMLKLIGLFPDLFKHTDNKIYEFRRAYVNDNKYPVENVIDQLKMAVYSDGEELEKLLLKQSLDHASSYTYPFQSASNFYSYQSCFVLLESNNEHPVCNASMTNIDHAILAKKGLDMLIDVAEVYSVHHAVKYAGDSLKSQIVGDAIKQTSISISKLQIFKKNIFKIISDLLSKLKNDIHSFKTEAQHKSSAHLIFTKFQISNVIKELKHEINDFLLNFKVADEYAQTFSKLEELSNIIISLFDKVRQHESSKSLAYFIASVDSVTLERSTFSDQATKQAIEKLKLSLKTSIVQDMAILIENSFQQTIFPFAKFFEDHLPRIDAKLKKNSTYLAVSKIEHIAGKLNEKENTVGSKYQEKVIFADFHSNGDVANPFFVWNNKKFETEICKLLSGNTIILNANVYGKNVKNAVKFSRIELKIVSVNKKKQSDLNRILNSFQIDMTHSGSNYLKCDNAYYISRSIPLKLVYSFEINNQTNTPTAENLNYKLLKKGNHILSPYTTWKLKLNTENTDMIKILKDNFCGGVDLQLIGSGSYLESNSKVCSEDLGKYYERVKDSITNVYNYDNYEIDAVLENTKDLI